MKWYKDLKSGVPDGIPRIDLNYSQKKIIKDRTVTLEEMIAGACGVLFLIGCAYFVSREVKPYDNYQQDKTTNSSFHTGVTLDKTADNNFYRRIK